MRQVAPEDIRNIRYNKVYLVVNTKRYYFFLYHKSCSQYMVEDIDYDYSSKMCDDYFSKFKEMKQEIVEQFAEYIEDQTDEMVLYEFANKKEAMLYVDKLRMLPDYATLIQMPYPNHSYEQHKAEIKAYTTTTLYDILEFNSLNEMFEFTKKYRMAKELQR